MLNPNNRRTYIACVAGLLFAAFLGWENSSPLAPFNSPQHGGDCPTACGAQQQNEPVGFWQTVEHDPVATFTLGLVAVTAWLAFATNRAANAAKTAAEALPIAERAYLFPDTKILARINWPETRNEKRTSEFYLRIWNHGKTPAVLRRITFAVIPRIADNEPTTKDIRFATKELITDRIVIESHGGPERFSGEFTISGEHVMALSGDSLLYRFFLIGRIFYDDIFGQSHETVFCRVCDVLDRGQDFNTFGPDELNYHT